MLQPKKTKYRKQFRGHIGGKAQSGFNIAFGEIGLKSLEGGWLSAAQIEAARRAITNFTKRSGKMWIRIFPDKPVTKKPSGSTMGGGKGDIDTYVAVIRPGKIIFELSGVEEKIAREALRRAITKLPLATKIVVRT